MATGSATAARHSLRAPLSGMRTAGIGRSQAQASRRGWRNSGHRTDELEARRAADAYWDKWLGLAALKPDLGRLAEASAPSKPRRKKSEDPPPSPPERQPDTRRQGRSIELDAAKAKVDDLQRRLERAEARAMKAEERASAAEDKAEQSDRVAKERIARMRAALGE